MLQDTHDAHDLQEPVLVSERNARKLVPGGHLDSYRITHRNSSDERDTELEACPNPVEFRRDEWIEGGYHRELIDSERVARDCGRKGCPYCGPQLRRRYVAHFASLFGKFAESGPVWFLTLTIDPKLVDEAGYALTAEESRKYAVWCWDKYLKRLRRRAEGLHYVAAFEQHKTGFWHLHVILFGEFDLSETPLRAMLRSQWFDSGGGAVARIKRIRANEGDWGDDGRPETVSGAVGYVVKYCFKDAVESVRQAVKRRSLLVSHGDGYHSEAAKEDRREWVLVQLIREAAGAGRLERPNAPNSGDSGVVETWEPLQTGVPSGYEDTLTPADRERFAAFDMSLRTLEYKEKSESEKFGEVWTVYRYDRRAETVEWTVWDRYPDEDKARILEVHNPNSSISGMVPT